MRGQGQGLGLLLGQAGEAGCSPTGFLLHGALMCPAQLALGVRQGFLRLSAPVFGLFLLRRWRTTWVSTACSPHEKDNLGMEDGEPCVARAQVAPAVCVGTVALPPAQSAGWDVGTKQAARCHPEASRAGGRQGAGGPVGSRSQGDPSCFAVPGYVGASPFSNMEFSVGCLTPTPPRPPPHAGPSFQSLLQGRWPCPRCGEGTVPRSPLPPQLLQPLGHVSL